MAVKDIIDYYNQVTSDYITMKNNLKELEKCISEDKAKEALYNIDELRSDVAKISINYRRLSYIMYLLNMPTKKSKREKYGRSEQKKLSQIPPIDRLDGVIQEDNDVLKKLKSYM